MSWFIALVLLRRRVDVAGEDLRVAPVDDALRVELPAVLEAALPLAGAAFAVLDELPLAVVLLEVPVDLLPVVFILDLVAMIFWSLISKQIILPEQCFCLPGRSFL
jgi:hypothetical protein